MSAQLASILCAVIRGIVRHQSTLTIDAFGASKKKPENTSFSAKVTHQAYFL
jgi:hypothetical protein